MRKFKILLGTFLYELIGRYLPRSTSKIRIGQKHFRAMCGKLILKKCGKNVNIERGACFTPGVSLGDNSGIGRNSCVYGRCTIGNDVMMGPDCIIYPRNHRFDDITIPINRQGYQEIVPVTVGDDVWIGGRVTILPGVSIGSHCIVGASAVVTKSVPDWAIVAGNPAKIIKYRKPPENQEQ